MQFDPRISPVDEHLKSQRQTLSPIDEKPIAYTSKKTRYKIPGFDVHMRKKEKLISGIDKKRNKKTVIGVQKNVDLTLNLNSNLASVGHEVDEEISSISFGDKNLMDLVEKADSRMRKHGVVNFMSKPVDVQNVDTSSDCVVINNNSAINTTSFDENECSEGFHKLHRDSDTQEIHIENCKPETITSFCETIADDDTMLRDDTFCSDNVLNEVTHKTKWNLQTTKQVYYRACKLTNVCPCTAFLRQSKQASVVLSGVCLSSRDVKPLAIALVRDRNILHLDLSNNMIGSVGVTYIAEMLQENTTLTQLDLSATNPTREGIKALSEALRHNRFLRYLRLEENEIEHTDSIFVADMIENAPSLKGLYLGHNKLGYFGGTAIASALAKNQTVIELDLRWNYIRRDSAVAIVRSLGSNCTLRRLNLSWNGLGKDGCSALAHALPNNTCLRELDITCNRVNMTALGFLIHGLMRNSGLSTLKVGQNPLTTNGAKSLLHAIMVTPQMDLENIDVTGIPIDEEFTEMMHEIRKVRSLNVNHEQLITLATYDIKRAHEGNDLDLYDPLVMLFEYMKLDNLRVIDMFQFMDTKKRDKLSKKDIRNGLSTLQIPVTEHALDVIHQKLDLDNNGFVELSEMMKVQREITRQVKLRQIRKKSKGMEDEGLASLRKLIRKLISKRKESNQARYRYAGNQTGNHTTSGLRKVSGMGDLQLTQTRFSVTSLPRLSLVVEQPAVTEVDNKTERHPGLLKYT